MALAFDGSTGYLEWDKGGGAMPVTTLPLTILAYATSNGATGSAQNIASSMAADGSVATFVTVDNSNSNVSATHNSNAATKSGGLSSSAFKLVVARYAGTTDRKIYLHSSAAPGSDSGSQPNDLSSHNRICIGAYHYSTNVIFQLAGSIAEVHLIAGAISTGDIDALLAASIKPEDVTGWADGWQLKTTSDLISMSGTRTLSLVGGVTNSGIAHPVARSGASGGGPLTRGLTRAQLIYGRCIA